MISKKVLLVLTFLSLFLFFNCAEENVKAERSSIRDIWSFSGQYFGQDPPGEVPEIFMPGFITSPFDDHGAVVFSPGGNSVYWNIVIRGGTNTYRGIMLFSELDDDKWLEPKIPDFADLNDDYWYPNLSSDGNTLYFASRRPIAQGDEPLGMYDGMRYWFVQWQTGSWSSPTILDTTVSDGEEFGFSLTVDGTIYFSSNREGGEGNLDLYRSRFVEGKYSSPENLTKFNTDNYEDGPYIAPDESYLIYSSGSPDDPSDILISFRSDDDNWTEPIRFPEPINSEKTDRWAKVTPDGKYLFFGSYRTGKNEIYWVDAGIIQKLRYR